MTLPLYDGGVASGLLAGILFGFVLEGAGFGSPRKLVAQFQLRDWAVFKVMFTAVVVCAAGLWLAEAAGMIKPNAVYVPTLWFWAVAAGGALMGAGFAIGGYCPGTSAAGLASGRVDAVVFIIGMVGGIWLFAAFFDGLRPLYGAAKGPDGQSLDALLGLPAIVVIGILAAVCAVGYAVARRFESRRGGPLGPPAG